MFKKWMRLIAAVTVILFAVVLVAGCGSSQPQQANAPKTTKVKIAISTWSGFGPLFIARDKGFFKKHGVDMDIEYIQGLAERKQALAGKKIDSLAITFDIVSQTASAGLPLKVVWALADSAGGDGILVKEGINSIQDLKGKNVAFDYGTAAHVFLTSVLDKAGMTEKDIKMVQMTGGDAGAAFVSGNIDAAVTWEPWLSKATKETKGKALVTSKDFPGLIVDTIAFHEDFAKANPEAVQGVVAAMKEAMEWYAANQEEGNKIMAQGLKISEQEMKENLQVVKLINYQDNVKMFGDADKPGVFYTNMQKIIDLYYSKKIITSKPDPKAIIDTSYLKKAK